MAVSPALNEKIESRRITVDKDGTVTAAEFLYQLLHESSSVSATVLAYNSTARTYEGCERETVTIEPVFIDTTNPPACIWDVRVTYSKQSTPEVDGSVVSFDTTGGTQHVKYSKSTRLKVADPAGPGVIDNKGAIGVSSSGGTITVEGIDITVPVYSWSETHKRKNAQLNQAAIYSLTGKVNSDGFKGFAPGEVLFLGASGQRTGDNEWELTYKFAASPNKTGIVIGPIQGIDKKGWEYLWVRFEDDAVNNGLTKTPVCAYVEVVYDTAAFSALGI